MKRFFAFLIYSVIVALILPMVVFSFAGPYMDKEKEKLNKNEESNISVYFHNEKKVKKLPLEDYICSVVAAEMPAEFEEEALKAQAVAARSYTLHRKNKPAAEHPDACVCTDYTHCKAYKSDAELKIMWKDNYKVYKEKIDNAVYSTKGEVITYDGEVALAVFHSQSGNGRTESSKDVWGGDIPYLVSVESRGEELAPNFYSTVTVTFDEFRRTLMSFNSSLNLDSPNDIGAIEKSEGGNVKNILIGTEKISGKDVRQLFNLRSSCFTINADADNVEFQVSGYGHGVGMSQYGANAMAKDGFDYKKILSHYYKGVQIVSV